MSARKPGRSSLAALLVATALAGGGCTSSGSGAHPGAGGAAGDGATGGVTPGGTGGALRPDGGDAREAVVDGAGNDLRPGVGGAGVTDAQPSGTGGAVDGGGVDSPTRPALPPIAAAPCGWRGVGVAHDLHYTPDGRKLIVSGGGYFKIFDAATGAHLGASGWQDGDIGASALSPDGRWVAGYSRRTGFGSGASVWQIDDPGHGRLLTPAVASDYPLALAFSPDSSLVASATEVLGGGSAAVIKVFRLADLTQIASLSAANFGAKILAFSADGAYLLVGSAGPSGADLSWKTTDWTPGPAGMPLVFNSEMPLEQHTDDFQAARGLSSAIFGTSLDFTLTGNATRYVISPGDVTLTSVKISHDGALVAAGAQDGRVFVYQPSQNFLLQLDDTPPTPRILTHATGSIPVVVFAPGDRQLAAVSADGTLDVWRLSDGTRVWSAAGLGGDFQLNVMLMAATPTSGSLMVGDGSENVVVLDGNADVIKARIPSQSANSPLSHCVASPDATAVACPDTDRAWLFVPGASPMRIGTALMGTLQARGGIALLPNGGGFLELITPAGEDYGPDADLLFWPPAAGAPVRMLAHLQTLPPTLVLSSDGKVAATLSDRFDGVRAWDVPAGTARGTWLPAGARPGEFGSIALSEHGEVLAAVGYAPNLMIARTGEPTPRLVALPGNAPAFLAAALSPNGALFGAAAQFDPSRPESNTFVVRVADAQPLMAVPGSSGRIAFTDNRTLARAETDGTVTYWCVP